MRTELRDYRIADGRLDAFVSRWRSEIVPLRRALGYRIDAAWTVPEESRLIWLLSLDVSPDEWPARNDAYYADPRRKAMDPDPASLIVEARHAFVTPVDLP